MAGWIARADRLVAQRLEEVVTNADELLDAVPTTVNGGFGWTTSMEDKVDVESVQNGGELVQEGRSGVATAVLVYDNLYPAWTKEAGDDGQLANEAGEDVFALWTVTSMLSGRTTGSRRTLYRLARMATTPASRANWPYRRKRSSNGAH
jgi:hypothetical protein